MIVIGVVIHMTIFQRIPGLLPVIISMSLLNLSTPVRLKKTLLHYFQNKNMAMHFNYVYYSR